MYTGYSGVKPGAWAWRRLYHPTGRPTNLRRSSVVDGPEASNCPAASVVFGVASQGAVLALDRGRHLLDHAGDHASMIGGQFTGDPALIQLGHQRVIR